MLQGAVEQDSVDYPSATEAALERMVIHELLQNWVLWRDAGDWDRFATVWHADGQMRATWFHASATEFIAGCRKAYDEGVVALHSLGAISVEVEGRRAVAQSKMQIVQRGEIEGIEVDVTCFGRFIDALEKRDGRWGIVQRQPVYELDRMTTVDPSKVLELDDDLLKSFPVGYRHVAYLQTKVGFTVYNNLPGTKGPAIEALMAQMDNWLHGADAKCFDS